MKVILLLLVSIAAIIEAQVPSFGPCPRVSVVQNFTPSRYLGKWYEQEKYFAIFERGKCITAKYAQQPNNVISVSNRQLVGNEFRGILGTATLAGPPNVGKLNVVFPSVPFQLPAPYWVLDTDYDNFAVVYSCNNFYLFNTKFAWILTREKFPSSEIMHRAYSVFKANGVPLQPLLKTDHQNCPN